MLGLPKLLKECDIHADYPVDIDDENVSECGFQSTLPGEPTRLSSALALFGAARIMSKVLDEVYPAASSHEITSSRRYTVPDVANRSAVLYARSDSQNSISSVASEPTRQSFHHKFIASKTSYNTITFRTPNLDYLPLSSFQDPSTSHNYVTAHGPLKVADLDRLTGFSPTQQIEGPANGLFPPPDVLSSYIPPHSSLTTHDWASDIWVMPPASNGPASAHSALGVSEEEPTSGEEFSTGDPIGDFPGIAMPNDENLDALDSLDGNIGL